MSERFIKIALWLHVVEASISRQLVLDGDLSVLHFLGKDLGLDFLPSLLYSQIVLYYRILVLHAPTKHPVPVILINY